MKILISLMFLSFNLFAEGTVGNGGLIIVCDEEVRWVLDYYEWEYWTSCHYHGKVTV